MSGEDIGEKPLIFKREKKHRKSKIRNFSRQQGYKEMKIPKFRDRQRRKQTSGLPPSRIPKRTKNKQTNGLPPSRKSKKPKKRIKPLSRWHPHARQITDWGIIAASVLLCLFLLPNRFPGMELLGIGANW
ncbi:MAG: hypothetical protein AAF630_03110, partial [Cyanobacteria bacterium P01_C01_bin.38]